MTAQELNTEFVEVKDAAYRYACSLLHSREEAEDLVQDLYEKLWRRRLLVRHKGFVQLVMVSVRNMCMDIMRQRQAERDKSVCAVNGSDFEERGGDTGINCSEEEFLWEEGRDREDMAVLVEKLIAGLPHREIPGDFFDLHNWKSNQVTLNCFNLGATNRRGNLGLSMALGIRANNYRFNDAITMENVGGNVNPVPLVGKVKKSKFTTAAIHVPMEMTFGNPRMMALSVGGFADLNFNSHTKIKYQDGNKVKDHKFPVNFIQAGLSARISCKYFSIYCNWYPGGVFKDGQGPKMQVWSVGIGL